MIFENNQQIHLTQPRDTVEIHLPDGRVYSGPRGASAAEFMRALPDWDNPPIVGALINDDLRELTFPIDMDAKIKPVSMSDADGARIYRRSITFLTEAAFEDLFPNIALTVDHSVASGGFYCELINHAPLTVEELAALDARMRDLVAANLPFERQNTPLKEAIDYFAAKGQTDKVRLLKYRQKDHLVLYRLGNHRDYHHGYMVPSTGYLRWFKLLPFGEGFVLQYPRRQYPTQLMPMPAYPKLLNAFHQYRDWLQSLGIESTGALNDAITEGRAKELVLVAEALHEQKISDIARVIAERCEESRIILIAGPSSSGKTTFSRRLAVQLLARGISPFPLEMDNYFVDRENTPLDAEGKFDFEALGALDTRTLGDHLRRLIAGEEVQLLHYNFKEGKSELGEVVRLRQDQLLILEGIHGLNPGLLPDIETSKTFRIYVSCLTQLNLDRYNRISTTDTRLLRRIVRDSRDRGYSAQDTIRRWESVRRGEKNHIFPFQENADDMFNSAMVYELSAMRLIVEPLLRQVQYGTPEYVEAKRLLAFLAWFEPVDDELIPANSIMREFIGGSSLKEFGIWKNEELE